MNPHATATARRPKDHMVLGTCARLPRRALSDGAAPPAEIRFTDHLFAFEGMRPRPGLVWGTWGVGAHRLGQTLCSRQAEQRNEVAVALRLFYRMPQATRITHAMCAHEVRDTGFMNLLRLKAPTQRVLQERWLARIEEEWGAARRQAVSDWPLARLAAAFAGYAQDLLHGPQDIGLSAPVELTLVVHPVQPGWQVLYNAPAPPIQVASARIDPARITGCDAQGLVQQAVVV